MSLSCSPGFDNYRRDLFFFFLSFFFLGGVGAGCARPQTWCEFPPSANSQPPWVGKRMLYVVFLRGFCEGCALVGLSFWQSESFGGGGGGGCGGGTSFQDAVKRIAPLLNSSRNPSMV